MIKFGVESTASNRRPSAPLSHHTSSLSSSTLFGETRSVSRYAPSTYAQSTIAASTIMAHVLHQPVTNSADVAWVEGHCLRWQVADEQSICTICEEKVEEDVYCCRGQYEFIFQFAIVVTAFKKKIYSSLSLSCAGCRLMAHGRCTAQIYLVCPVAFHPGQIQAAFVRCFASLFYTYRKFLHPSPGDQKAAGKIYRFNMEAFLRSIPRENAQYMQVLRQTQGKEGAAMFTLRGSIPAFPTELTQPSSDA